MNGVPLAINMEGLAHDLAYQIYRFKGCSDEGKNYYQAQRLLDRWTSFHAMDRIEISPLKPAFQPFYSSKGDRLAIATTKELLNYFKVLADQVRLLRGKDPESFEGCLHLHLGKMDVYPEDFNEALAETFPSIRGLILEEMSCFQGWDEGYTLQDLPSSIVYLKLDFDDVKIDFSGLNWTSIECLELLHTSFGRLLDDFCFPFSHSYPKLKIVVTPCSSHRSCDFCTVSIHPLKGDRREGQMISFRYF